MTKQSITIEQARELLPKETDGLMDSQVQGVLSAVGEIEPSELKDAWKKHIDQHLAEWASFLHDMYQEKKLKDSANDNGK